MVRGMMQLGGFWHFKAAKDEFLKSDENGSMNKVEVEIQSFFKAFRHFGTPRSLDC